MQTDQLSLLLNGSLERVALAPGQWLTGQVKLTRGTSCDSIESLIIILAGTAEAICHRIRGKSAMPLLCLEYQLAYNESLPSDRTVIWPFSVQIPSQVHEAHCYGSRFDGSHMYIAVPQNTSGLLPLPPSFKDRSGHPMRAFAAGVTYELSAKARYSGRWLGDKRQILISSGLALPGSVALQACTLQSSRILQCPKSCPNVSHHQISPNQHRLLKIFSKPAKTASTDEFKVMTSIKKIYSVNGSLQISLWLEQLVTGLTDCGKECGGLLVYLVNVKARLTGITHYRVAAQDGFSIGSFKSQLHLWNMDTSFVVGGPSNPRCLTLNAPNLTTLTESFSTLNISRTYTLSLEMRLKCMGKRIKTFVQHPIEIQGHGTVLNSAVAAHWLAAQDARATPDVSHRGQTPPPAYVA